MLNREQMQEQLIRYSESVRAVDATNKVMAREVSDLSRKLDRLHTSLDGLAERSGVVAGSQQNQIEILSARIDTLAVNTGERLRVPEAASRTFWGRVRYVLIGR